MGRLLAVVAAALAIFAGVNLVLSAGRALSGTETATPVVASITPSTSPAVSSPPPPTTVGANRVPATVIGPAMPEAPAATVPAPEAADTPAGPAEPAPPAVGPPPPVFDALATLPTEPPPAFAAAIPQGIGCGAEPFASAFVRTGFTPSEVNVGSCEIVLDIPGRTPTDQVCAQVSGPPVARSIHIAQRTVDGECRRDAFGVVIHEIGHAWHLADPTRFYRVLATFGLDPRADASLEVVAECFVEAVGVVDTDCGPQGAAYVRAEMDASRGVG
jgi:hypothetical protein